MDTRRRFIRDCSALAASAALIPTTALATPRRWRAVSLADVSFEHLAAQVNSGFILPDANGGAQALELIEAEMAAPAQDGDNFARAAGGESFSLLFRGDAARPLGQNTYSFEHARIGRFEMFIVPIGCEDRGHCYYEAVFNRLPPESRRRTVVHAATRQKPYG